jgi:hypothetical protein
MEQNNQHSPSHSQTTTHGKLQPLNTTQSKLNTCVHSRSLAGLKLDAGAVHAVALIGGRWEALTLQHAQQVEGTSHKLGQCNNPW